MVTYFDKREGRTKTIPDCSKHGLIWNDQTQRCEIMNPFSLLSTLSNVAVIAKQRPTGLGLMDFGEEDYSGGYGDWWDWSGYDYGYDGDSSGGGFWDSDYYYEGEGGDYYYLDPSGDWYSGDEYGNQFGGNDSTGEYWEGYNDGSFYWQDASGNWYQEDGEGNWSYGEGSGYGCSGDASGSWYCPDGSSGDYANAPSAAQQARNQAQAKKQQQQQARQSGQASSGQGGGQSRPGQQPQQRPGSAPQSPGLFSRQDMKTLVWGGLLVGALVLLRK